MGARAAAVGGGAAAVTVCLGWLQGPGSRVSCWRGGCEEGSGETRGWGSSPGSLRLGHGRGAMEAWSYRAGSDVPSSAVHGWPVGPGRPEGMRLSPEAGMGPAA